MAKEISCTFNGRNWFRFILWKNGILSVYSHIHLNGLWCTRNKMTCSLYLSTIKVKSVQLMATSWINEWGARSTLKIKKRPLMISLASRFSLWFYPCPLPRTKFITNFKAGCKKEKMFHQGDKHSLIHATQVARPKSWPLN